MTRRRNEREALRVRRADPICDDAGREESSAPRPEASVPDRGRRRDPGRECVSVALLDVPARGQVQREKSRVKCTRCGGPLGSYPKNGLCTSCATADALNQPKPTRDDGDKGGP